MNKFTCNYCGKDYKSYKKTSLTCSRRCANKYRAVRNKSKFKPDYRPPFTCNYCGKDYKSYHKTSLTCSRRCANKARAVKSKFKPEYRPPVNKDIFLYKSF